jgi:DNA-binding LacI/PurR family transcriptional regulator
MNTENRITIRKVADAAGVSKQTVSRVINDHPDVADRTRKRVQEVIDQLGYHPSAVARSLTKQRTRMIVVVTAGLNLIGPSSVLNGVSLKAEELGYTLLLKNLPDFYVRDYQELIRYIIEMRVEGVAWVCPEIDHNRRESIEKLSKLPVPIIFQGSSPIKDALVVTIDNYGGGCLATQHLIDQGFREIGHISGPLEFGDAEARKEGWFDSLQKIGSSPTDMHWTEGDWSAASGAKALSDLLDKYPDMEAIFVANDQMAIGAIQRLHDCGLQVPGDLAIIGYDNIPESAYNSPPLSTISQDFHAMGAKTIEVLVDAIKAQQSGKEPPGFESVILNTDLIIRKSSIRNR